MSDDVSKQSSSQMVISVGSLPLIARITGSVTRKQSTRSALALDASVSRDPDVDAAAEQGLAFVWACSLSDGTSSQACRDTSGALLVLSAASTLQVPAGTLPATTDAAYQFTVTVSKVGKSPAAYTLSLTLVAQAIPNVELAVSGEFFRQTDGSIKINANSVFSLTATCSMLAGLQSWSIDPSAALTAPALSSATAHALLYLGTGSNALVPGASYLITSECTVVGELETATGSAEQMVVVNSPPAGVPCRACFVDGDDAGGCATTGEPVFDLLLVSCDNWADSDGGLLYRFGYQVCLPLILFVFSSFQHWRHWNLFCRKAMLPPREGRSSFEGAGRSARSAPPRCCRVQGEGCSTPYPPYPKPRTLNPQPYTLNPKSSIQTTQPQTSNPKPETRNPKP
jgi:hypothetical protein